jgi:hypothetical protein
LGSQTPSEHSALTQFKVVPEHCPARHASLLVQALRSSQRLPSGRGSAVQTSLASSHVTAAHRGSPGHARGAPVQKPELHASFVVQN